MAAIPSDFPVNTASCIDSMEQDVDKLVLFGRHLLHSAQELHDLAPKEMPVDIATILRTARQLTPLLDILNQALPSAKRKNVQDHLDITCVELNEIERLKKSILTATEIEVHNKELLDATMGKTPDNASDAAKIVHQFQIDRLTHAYKQARRERLIKECDLNKYYLMETTSEAPRVPQSVIDNLRQKLHVKEQEINTLEGECKVILTGIIQKREIIKKAEQELALKK